MGRQDVAAVALFQASGANATLNERRREIGGEEAGKRAGSGADRSIDLSVLRENPSACRDTIVTVSGQVTAGLAFEFVNEQPYTLDDGTDRVWIITKSVMPKEGSQVVVTGTVKAPYQIKGRRYDLVVIETERTEIK